MLWRGVKEEEMCMLPNIVPFGTFTRVATTSMGVYRRKCLLQWEKFDNNFDYIRKH